jgi:hypothetical protein
MRAAAVWSFGLMLMAAGAAQAACPAVVPNSTSETLTANQQRLLCLQNEIRQNANEERQDTQIEVLQNQVQRQQVQRRFDALPSIQLPRQF